MICHIQKNKIRRFKFDYLENLKLGGVLDENTSIRVYHVGMIGQLSKKEVEEIILKMRNLWK